jgi:hypothetical protein
MIDVIALLYLKEISLDEAYDIVDVAVEKFHADEITIEWWKYLQMSKYEVSAYAHGGSLEDLLYLRYVGWPNKCMKCNLFLDYQAFGWWLIHIDGAIPQLQHITCPNKM